jgi:outer membrane immunogenic protein
MKKLFLASIALVALNAGGSALAADLVVKARPMPPPVPFSWTGFYIGAHLGGAWGSKDWADPTNGLDEGVVNIGSHDVSGFIAGGQIGFNWQAPGSNWVLGVEGQFSWADLPGDHGFTDNILKTKVGWFGTVAGRLGYAFDRVLVYAKGGFAFAHDKFEHADLDGGIIDHVEVGDQTRTGWMVGGGIEWALSGNWSLKGEYNYMNFAKKSVTLVGPEFAFLFDIDQQIHVAKFGINYRFGGFGKYPVAARY